MTGEMTPLGRITISERAIATIASQAALRSYGVVGMAAKNLVDGLTHVLARDPRHGVDIHVDGDVISIDMYVIVEYGTRIASVAASVANTVHYQVERSLGMPVEAVNVHVQDLRITSYD
jgi:uncharacterized alkaline shock family protein YloU